MQPLYRGVLTLIRCAITGETGVLPENFDPEAAWELMKRHQLLSIGYVGARLCGLPGSDPAVGRFYQGYCRSAMVNQRQMEAVGQIYAAFDRAGLDYMPVKGCNMKLLYPQPEYRIMGDADILIRPEQYDRVRRAMLDIGFGEEHEAGNVMEWRSRSLNVELHKSLMPYDMKAFNRVCGDGWKLASRREGTHWYMDPEDEFFFVFVHFAKHYQLGGIGLRQILDLWICRRAWPEMDEGRICRSLDRLGLLRFYRNVLKTLEVWFGSGEENEVTGLITEYIMSSGSWGSEKAGCLSVAARQSEKTESDRTGRRQWIVRIFFPEPEAMAVRYPPVAGHPALLPVFWVWRWLEVLWDHPRNIRRKLHLAGHISDREVSDFRRAMNAVGLTFLDDE